MCVYIIYVYILNFTYRTDLRPVHSYVVHLHKACGAREYARIYLVILRAYQNRTVVILRNSLELF